MSEFARPEITRPSGVDGERTSRSAGWRRGGCVSGAARHCLRRSPRLDERTIVEQPDTVSPAGDER